MQNVSFQGRSNLTFSNSVLSRLETKGSDTNRRFRYGDQLRIHQSKVFAFNTNDTDLYVIVKGDKNGIVKKVKPQRETPNQVLLDLEEAIENFKKTSKDKLTAWILGGRADDEKAISTVNNLADLLCDRPDIDTSILTGYKNGYINKFLIRNHEFPDVDIIVPKPINLSRVDDLENIFQTVELNNVQTMVS